MSCSYLGHCSITAGSIYPVPLQMPLLFTSHTTPSLLVFAPLSSFPILATIQLHHSFLCSTLPQSFFLIEVWTSCLSSFLSPSFSQSVHSK
uniref:Uncharacterized protein n=1 Tax=Arundo donax TaxID=35708 RepID=A0A0A9DMZ4_ARUDO